jgi:hypothetical protein
VGVLAARDVVLEVRVGVKEITLHTTLAAGQLESQTQSLPVAPALVDGRLMVPLGPLCQALGISTASPPPSSLAAEDHPDPQATGVIVGEVEFGNRPLEGVVLRLVRAADSTFVRSRRVVSDGHGRYRFPGLPAGSYRVYAYAGDNPEYFNRQSPAVEVKQSLINVARLAMGWIIAPRLPTVGARVPAGTQVLVRWEVCPGASEYELSLLDRETQQEIALPRVSDPEALLAADILSPGHSYQIRVTAHAYNESFLGATPGTGAAPWVFAVARESNGPPRDPIPGRSLTASPEDKEPVVAFHPRAGKGAVEL